MIEEIFFYNELYFITFKGAVTEKTKISPHLTKKF